MSRSKFAGDIFLGMGNFADGFDVSEVIGEGREQTAMDNAAIADNNGRTSRTAMRGEAEIESAKYTTDQGGFLENAAPGIIDGAFGFAQIGMENGMFGGNPLSKPGSSTGAFDYKNWTGTFSDNPAFSFTNPDVNNYFRNGGGSGVFTKSPKFTY
tara:strand:- start:393 stop:857 length:465 start_codon:yes stop_codon:yes gene_type:complete